MTPKVEVTAEELFRKLIDSEILNSSGKILFELNGTTVAISTKDTVGSSLQSWLGCWMEEQGIYYDEPEGGTQVFPDFLLKANSTTEGLLEVKSFNHSATPAFDIANFESYCTSLLTNPYRLDADYLIFSYSMHGSEVYINDLWLKKIWELSSPSGPWPVKVQAKRGMIYNLRPTTWYSERLQFNPFSSRSLFLKALADTLEQYDPSNPAYKDWLDRVIIKYQEQTGIQL